MTDDLSLKELNQYHGTEQYHNIGFGNYKLTDGIIYLMKNGYSWFITDFISVGMTDEKIKQDRITLQEKSRNPRGVKEKDFYGEIKIDHKQ